MYYDYREIILGQTKQLLKYKNIFALLFLRTFENYENLYS